MANDGRNDRVSSGSTCIDLVQEGWAERQTMEVTITAENEDDEARQMPVRAEPAREYYGS